MPELPEVESFKKYIDKTSLHQKIEVIKLTTSKVLLNTKEKELQVKVMGNFLEETFRHGKFLFIKLHKHGNLLLHFGLTGDLVFVKSDADPPRIFVLQLHFENGNSLYFTDTRKMGKVGLVDDIETFIAERGYGEDALKIKGKDFINRLEKKRVAVKTTLMNQKLVSGVGNEFSDEILFQVGIHPASITAKLSTAQLKTIYREMVSILKEAIKHNAERSKLDHYFFLDNRKAGLKCPGCKGTTAFETVGGRSAYFCPSCQKLYD